MPDAQDAEIIALGKDPIRPDAPAGDSCRYEDEFAQLSAQIDRIGSIEGKEVEWDVVVAMGAALLKNKSKDLLVMTYYALGVFEREGWKRVPAVLEAYSEFLKNFWEPCFPKIKPPAHRLNAVGFFIDRVLPQIELKGGACKKEPRPGDKEAVHLAAAKGEEWAKVVQEKFGSITTDTPNTAPLVRAFKALQSKVGPLVEDKPAAPAAAPSGGEGAAEGAAPRAAGPATFATPAQAIEQLKAISRFLMAQDAKDARAYRLSRIAYFGGLDLPKDKMIPGIPPATRSTIEGLASSGDWQALLTAAEAQFLITPLWLDLQRFVATALGGQGPAYQGAKQAVIFETVALQSRLPAVFDLSFKDGKSFADGATKAWLADARAEIGGGAGGGPGTAADKISGAVGEARKLLGDAKPIEAVARIGAEIDGSAARRDQFRAQLALAKFCMDMNKPTVAESILDGLEALIGHYRLEEWEPALAAEALMILFDCHVKNRPRPTPDDARRRADVFARLCRLNPTAALRIEAASPAAAKPAPAPAAAAPAPAAAAPAR